jgi:molybdopterin/thiamine biosynthesis adenylyltransferase
MGLFLFPPKTSLTRPSLTVERVANCEGRVLIVGAGGLGIPAGMLLAAAGLRELTVVDPEAIELSNLPRQVLYHDNDLGKPKAEVMARRLRDTFANLRCNAIVGRLSPDNATALIARHDFVLDATDDPLTKFLINDACLAARVPFTYGGVLGFQGQALTVIPGQSACLRCLFETPPASAELQSCREAGILGPVAGFIGAVQAGEATAWLSGTAPRLRGRVLTYDLRQSRARTVMVRPRAECPCRAEPEMAPVQQA